jgi:hypothetical protein
MLFLIAFVGAAIIALVLWKAMNASRSTPPPVTRRPPQLPPTRTRVSGPDDDPEFLRQLDEKVKRRDDPPAG